MNTTVRIANPTALLLAPLAGGMAILAADATATPAKPALSFQYRSEDIAILAATALASKIVASHGGADNERTSTFDKILHPLHHRQLSRLC